MAELNRLVADSGTVGKSYTSGGKSYTIGKADNFCYTDPVDGSVTKNQVIAGTRVETWGGGVWKMGICERLIVDRENFIYLFIYLFI